MASCLLIEIIINQMVGRDLTNRFPKKTNEPGAPLLEIKNLTANPVFTYPFDEIPTCGTSGNGKKRHLDETCHN
jgi:ABC-type sugar transport system ATPase subunit